MFAFVITIHITACIGLIFFILIQQGKGGGLIESFSSAESIFGSNTSTFLTKATTVLAVAFFITCLLLAFISVQQSKSVVERIATTAGPAGQETEPLTQTQEPSAAENQENVAVPMPAEQAASEVQAQEPNTTESQENNAASAQEQQN